MNETLGLMTAVSVGVALGVFFFGGLWWTVRKGVATRRPALWFFGSLLLRTSVTLVGFYFAGGGRWERLLACLLGFIAARLIIVTRLTRPKEDNRTPPTQEAGHAPQS